MWHSIVAAGTLHSWHCGQNLSLGRGALSAGGAFDLAACFGMSFSTALSACTALGTFAHVLSTTSPTWTATDTDGLAAVLAVATIDFTELGGIAVVLAVAANTSAVLGGIALPAILELGPAVPALLDLVGAGGAGGGSCLREPELELPSFSSCTRVLSTSIFFLALGGWNHNLSPHI